MSGRVFRLLASRYLSDVIFPLRLVSTPVHDRLILDLVDIITRLCISTNLLNSFPHSNVWLIYCSMNSQSSSFFSFMNDTFNVLVGVVSFLISISNTSYSGVDQFYS